MTPATIAIRLIANNTIKNICDSFSDWGRGAATRCFGNVFSLLRVTGWRDDSKLVMLQTVTKARFSSNVRIHCGHIVTFCHLCCVGQQYCIEYLLNVSIEKSLFHHCKLFDSCIMSRQTEIYLLESIISTHINYSQTATP